MDMLLQVEDVSKRFRRKGSEVQAVSHVSFQIETGQCMGLIGESGSGKSTLAGILAGFQKADGGRVIFMGKDILSAGGRAGKNRQYMQMVFQNPKSSLNPRMKIGQNLAEAVRYYKDASVEDTGARCREVMGLVELLRDLQREYQMGLLFISHDIALVSSLCTHILVLKEGKIVESGETREVVHTPRDAYTRHLLDSVIRIEESQIKSGTTTTVSGKTGGFVFRILTDIWYTIGQQFCLHIPGMGMQKADEGRFSPEN